MGRLCRRAQDPVAGDDRADLLQDFPGVAVLQRIAHHHGEGGEDFPVRTAVADRLEPGADLLDEAFGVREGAGLLGIGAGRQDDIGQPGRFRQEEFLDDEQVQLLQRLGGLHGQGQAPHWIFADDDHGLQLSRAGRVEHLHQAHPFRSRWLVLPRIRHPAPRRGIGELGRAGEVFRRGAHLDGALLVVLFGERSETPAGLRELADQQQEVQKVHCGVVAAGRLQQVLSDQEHPAPRTSKRPCDGAKRGLVQPFRIRQGRGRRADA